MSDGGHYVYILECGDGSLYTGYTTDVSRRISEHRAGDGAQYTRGRGPLRLVHVETFDSRSTAMQRENTIKSLRTEAKRRLIADDTGPPNRE